MSARTVKFFRPTCLSLVGLLVAGCTSHIDAPSLDEEYQVWLWEAPRTIELSVNQNIPQPDLISRDHKVGEKTIAAAGTGLTYAGTSFLYGCGAGAQTGDPFGLMAGCALGLAISPFALAVGAAKGAGSVDTVETHHPLSEQSGAADLFADGRMPNDLSAMILSEILLASEESEKHKFIASSRDEEKHIDRKKFANMDVSVSRISLLSELGDDPSLALLIRGSASLYSSELFGSTSYDFNFEGSERRLSQWRLDDAKLFRQELKKATKKISSDILTQANRTPSDEIIATVEDAWERRKRRLEEVKTAEQLDHGLAEKLQSLTDTGDKTADKTKGFENRTQEQLGSGVVFDRDRMAIEQAVVDFLVISGGGDNCWSDINLSPHEPCRLERLNYITVEEVSGEQVIAIGQYTIMVGAEKREFQSKFTLQEKGKTFQVIDMVPI